MAADYLLFGHTPYGYTAQRPPFQTFVRSYETYRAMVDDMGDHELRRGDITHYIVYSRHGRGSDSPLFADSWTFQEIIGVRVRTREPLVMGTPPGRCYSNDMETFFFN